MFDSSLCSGEVDAAITHEEVMLDLYSLGYIASEDDYATGYSDRQTGIRLWPGSLPSC
jgi:hypothetical protein